MINKKLLLTMLVFLMAIPAFARDFTYTYEGQTVTYTVISEDQKTCETKGGTMIWSQHQYVPGNSISGDLVLPSNPGGYTLIAIGDGTFHGCSGLTSITIPESVTSIGSGAFMYCSGLTSITIPESVTSIGGGAFAYCSGLTTITIPESVTSIGDFAFNECSALETITLYQNLKSFGYRVFEYCEAIKNVIYRGETPVGADENVFDSSVYENATLFVKEGKVSAFQAVSPWKYFSNITDTEYVSGVENIITEEVESSEKEIYTLNGIKVASSTDTLAPGIYIVCQGGKTKKIIIN